MIRPELPIDSVLPALLDALRQHDNVVLQAPTGAGKTTRVGPALLAAGLAPAGRIVMLEPRRLAARAAARRMAEEQGEPLGAGIGYHVRFDRCFGPQTRLLVVTEGVLLRSLGADPFLTDTDIVILDEFHERRLESDLLLGMLRLLQTTVRPQLKIVVMSATLDAQRVASYLEPCPTVTSEGRLFPVEVRYLPRSAQQPWPSAILGATEQVVGATEGDILVFVPGVREIRQTCEVLSQRYAGRLRCVPLYGDLPPEKQDEALRGGSSRRIVVATNVAETSVTVEGITAVIDTGLARQQQYDPRLGLDRLQLVPISQASADQRTGRAGRLQPGLCIRLWSQQSHGQRPAHSEPEIRRVDLAAALLQLKGWVEPNHETFPWFERPREASVEQALALLERLGALRDGHLTALGKKMAQLPVHPRLARMLLEGQRLGQTRRVALAAALLSERSPIQTGDDGWCGQAPARVSQSDVLDEVELLEQYEQDRRRAGRASRIHPGLAGSVLRTRDQLARLTGSRRSDSTTATVDADEALLRALVVAFPDRVAKRREPGSRKGRMVGGRGIALAPSSTVLESPLIVCVDVDGGASESLVRKASLVEREWLPRERVSTRVELEFDEATERVIARRRVRFEDLVLDEHPAPLPGKEEVARALAEAARERLDRVRPPADSDAARWMTRVRCLAGWMPDRGLPEIGDQQLLEVLPHLCHGRRSFAELREAPWIAALEGFLDYDQQQLVAREAPERLVVPSGRRIPLMYELGRPPVLAVRIQEIFGLRSTPRVAGGRVPVLLHLLAPSHRPVQVTDDLDSFWKNTYPRVRQELRRKYPKHAWPEDPLTAPPSRGGQGRAK